MYIPINGDAKNIKFKYILYYFSQYFFNSRQINLIKLYESIYLGDLQIKIMATIAKKILGIQAPQIGSKFPLVENTAENC